MGIAVRRSLVSCAAVLLLASPAAPQVVTAPNQIVGHVRWTNANPEILARLNAPTDVPPGLGEGMTNADLYGESRPPQAPDLSHSTQEPGNAGMRLPYVLTVESGMPGAGIAYDVRADIRATGNRTYKFAAVASAPVEREPAPDVSLDLPECAALVDVQWIHDDDGSPATVTRGSMEAFRPAPSTGELTDRQATGSWSLPTTRERLIVRGDGSEYRIRIIFELGNDPFHDTVRATRNYFIVARCDEIVPIVIRLGRDGGICEDPPEIIGVFDVVGEDEIPYTTESTRLWAEDGPNENYRWDLIADDPASGPFRFENLYPSNFVEPAVGYIVGGVTAFRRHRRYQRLIPPQLDDINGRVFANQRDVVDLGDTFVMEPGFVRGDILVAGPPAPAVSGGASLEDLVLVDPADPDGIPDDMPPRTVPHHRRFSYPISVTAAIADGRAVVAPGARHSASGGEANAAIDGSYRGDHGRFEGSYELVLPGLHGEPAIWDAGSLRLGFDDRRSPGVPESYRHFSLTWADDLGDGLLIEAGRTAEVPLHLCLSEVRVSFRAGAGSFLAPIIAGGGSHAGVDFEGRTVGQTFSTWAHGTPRADGTPGTSGMVVLALPHGVHRLQPSVREIDPGGGTSTNQLPTFELAVGCRQVIEVSTSLRLLVDGIDACARATPLTMTGRAEGEADVARIAWSVNGGPESVACEPCGHDPSFAFEVHLPACDASIRITAVDVDGNEAAVTTFTRLDAGPLELAGCADVDATAPTGASGAIVTYPTPTVDDSCGGGALATCVPASGETFALGDTEVTCTATDACGNTGRCAFTVHVLEAVVPLVVDAGPDREICPGGSARIGGAPPVTGGSPPLTFAWTPATGLDDASSASPLASPAATTTYTLTVTDSRGQVSSDACTVVVLPAAPVAAFSVPPGPWCEDAPVCFANASAGADAYEWTFGTPTGDASGDESPCFAFPDAGTFTVTLLAIGRCGTDSAQAIVEIAPKPRADFTFDLGRTACIGSEVSFFEQASADATSWAWDFGDGTTSNLPDPVHSFATDGIHVVSLAACNACGCSAPVYRAVEIAADCNTDCGANSNQLACGDSPVLVTGDTCSDADRTNTGSYPCAAGRALTGPNRTYDLNFPPGANFLIRLVETDPEPNGYDLDLMILSACNPPECVAWGDESVVSSDDDPSNNDTWLLVDGRDGSCGPYRLEVLCLGPGATGACTPPAAIGSPRVADADPCTISGVSLAWDEPTSWGAGPDGAACASGSYEIWRAPLAAPDAWVHVGSSLLPTFLDRNVVPGREHVYRVVPRNACCGEPGVASPAAPGTDRFSDPIDASAGSDRLIACGATQVRLLGHASGGSGGGLDVHWEPSALVSDPATLSPFATSPGTYVLTVTDRDSGCTATDEVLVDSEAGSAREPSALDVTPGATPLRVSRLPDGRLALSWEDVAAEEYRVFEGSIGSLRAAYDHEARWCGLTSPGATIAATASQGYYLVASADCRGALSSLGRSSRGSERPAPTDCR